MKQLLGLTMTMGLLIGASASAGNYGMAGCGLGSMIFEENAKIQQVVAATTNGIGTQTFAITSGTSNCGSDGVVSQKFEAQVFVAANYDTLHQEMAKGSGESVATLAHLVGCPTSATASFAKSTQSHFVQLSQAASAEAFLTSIATMVANDATLAHQCSLN